MPLVTVLLLAVILRIVIKPARLLQVPRLLVLTVTLRVIFRTMVQVTFRIAQMELG